MADTAVVTATRAPVSVRRTFERELDGLQGAVVTMGELADKAIFRAADALERRSPTMARRVVREDERINRQRADAEGVALQLLATQQPMASDLRFLTAVLHLTTDLERIGDHARNVGRAVVSLDALPGEALALAGEVLTMAALDRRRLQGALAALRGRDVQAAREIAAGDAETDALQGAAYRVLLASMQADPAFVRQAALLLQATYNFERIGDRVTNICERVIYTATGHLEELDTFPGDRV